MKFEAMPSKEKPNTTLENMHDRAGWASEKVQEAMNNKFLKRFSNMDEEEIEHELDRLEADFHELVRNPGSPYFSGRYADWTPDEIKELFSVMYGREFGSSKIRPVEQMTEHKKEDMTEALNKRLENASPKVKQRVLERFLPRLQQYGEEEYEIFLSQNESPFLNLAVDPKDESGGGHYKGWTADETKELYRVLYGEEPRI